MRWIIKLLFSILAVLSFVSCNRPKTIPDDKLEAIFKEIYLTNAFMNDRNYVADTLDIYRPIFNKYGYTIGDLKYTIDGFSKRKSSKFTDIIVAAKDQINSEYKGYLSTVQILNYIDSVAAERYKKQVYFRDSIRVFAIKDTSKLTVSIPIKSGRYKIEYSYILDTADKNRSLRATHTMFDSITSIRAAYTNNWFNRGMERRRHSVMMNVERGENRLLLQLGNYPSRNMTKPYLSIDSLEVTYYLTKEVALDSLTRDIIKENLLPKLFQDLEDVEHTKDSIPLLIRARGVDPPRDSLPGQ